MEKSQIAFVIMQIGNADLDNIYKDIFIPAIKAANLEPKRIDIDNTGSLLKKEITEYIENAEIILADLTNERPNCYLEVGYTMGLDKYKNLIFTVREDHYHASANYKKGIEQYPFTISSVIPKMVFIQISLQMLLATMVMDSPQPPFDIHYMNMQIGKSLP